MLSGRMWMLVAAGVLIATPSFATEPLEFFTVYMGQMGAQEAARAATLATVPGTASEKFQACVKNTHDFSVLLHGDAVVLSAMSFDNFMKDMVPGLAELGDTRAELEGQLGAVCMSLAESGHPAEEIATLSQAGPAISEKILQAESIVFDAMPLLVRALYVEGAAPEQPGAKLVITRAQRDALIGVIDQKFPATLKGKSADEIVRNDNGSYAVASAGLLKALLLTAKGSDEG